MHLILLSDFVTPPKKGAILDKQPVTFKTKIKSSGYTAAPRYLYCPFHHFIGIMG
jgi:hypothetical protein